MSARAPASMTWRPACVSGLPEAWTEDVACHDGVMVSHFALVAGSVPRNGVSYWEPTIDGKSLRSLLDLGWGPFGGEFAPVLIHSWPVGMTEDVRVLLGEHPPQLSDGRVLIYVCSECGDLGCGAVSMVVERNDAHVIWRDFEW